MQSLEVSNTSGEEYKCSNNPLMLVAKSSPPRPSNSGAAFAELTKNTNFNYKTIFSK